MAFEVRQQDRDGIRLLELEGSLDARGGRKLETVLAECLREGRQGLLLDVSRLELVDGAGLRVLVTAAERLEAAGGRLALCGPAGEVKRVFGVARMERRLSIHSSRQEALRWLEKSVRAARIARLAGSLLRKSTPGVPDYRHMPPDTARLELATRLLGLMNDTES